jgi:hypothetical protein
MKTFKSSSAQFSLVLTFWALVSLGILSFLMVVVAKLNFSFFEANGMLRDDFMREALAHQLFLAIDPMFFVLLLLGLVGVAVVTFLFARSQCGYVERMKHSLQLYAERLEIPPVAGLGPLAMHMADFLEVIHLRVKRDSKEKIDEAVEKALRDWPQAPKISMNDMFQFIVLSLFIAMFFAICCVTFFLQVSNRIVELGQTVARYTTPAGPRFLQAQYELVNLLMWSIIGVTGAAFVIHGYRFGRRLSESNYALLRDLRKFMQGDFNQRLFLRTNDPVSEQVPPMNDALSRIQKKL